MPAFIYIPSPLKKQKCSFCGKSIMRRKMKTDRYYCGFDCKAAWQRLQKPVTREWLYQKYIVEKLGAPEIAKIVKRHSKRVYEWLVNEGIPTRPRGSDERQQIKKGDVSLFKGKHHSKKTIKLMSKIAIAQGRVPFDPAIGSYMKGRKGENTPNWKGGITPERQAFYSSMEWVEAVKAIWKRDNATCQRCNKRHNEINNRGTFHIHHIISFMIREKRADINNLILLCNKCHKWIHSNKNKTNSFIKEF